MSGVNNTNIKADDGVISLTGEKYDLYTFSTSGMLPSTPLPDKSAAQSKTKHGTNPSPDAIAQGVADFNTGLGAYSSLVTKVKQMTGLNLPDVASTKLVKSLTKLGNTYTDITGTLANNQNGSRILTDNTNPQPGAFKWVEFESEPRDFVSYDSVLLFVGEPLWADNDAKKTFTPLGACQNFSMNAGVNITAIQELRCEEQIIIPGKTQPTNINISRLCGIWSNLINRVHNIDTQLEWNYGLHYKGMRDLFGLYVLVLDTSRRNIITSFYVERCALTAFQLGISAGSYQIVEGISITAGRIVDPNRVQENTQESVLYGKNKREEEQEETVQENPYPWRWDVLLNKNIIDSGIAESQEKAIEYAQKSIDKDKATTKETYLNSVAAIQNELKNATDEETKKMCTDAIVELGTQYNNYVKLVHTYNVYKLDDAQKEETE